MRGLAGQRLGISCMDQEMTLHDAAMSRFGQWWRRNIRNGHAFAESAVMHGDSPARHWVRQTKSNWFWGSIWPGVAICLAWPSRDQPISGGGDVFGLMAKVNRYCRRRGRSRGDAFVYSIFCVLGKFPQAWGQLTYRLGRLMGRGTVLIEYKAPAAAERS